MLRYPLITMATEEQIQRDIIKAKSALESASYLLLSYEDNPLDNTWSKAIDTALYAAYLITHLENLIPEYNSLVSIDE